MPTPKKNMKPKTKTKRKKCYATDCKNKTEYLFCVKCMRQGIAFVRNSITRRKERKEIKLTQKDIDKAIEALKRAKWQCVKCEKFFPSSKVPNLVIKKLEQGFHTTIYLCDDCFQSK